jgi:carboxymethylenebutenolidase
VPIYLFFGGQDRFIPGDRVRQIQARFESLGKDYKLKVYPDANHGFFCNERSDYHPTAAVDAWEQLTQFLAQYLLTKGCQGDHPSAPTGNFAKT